MNLSLLNTIGVAGLVWWVSFFYLMVETDYDDQVNAAWASLIPALFAFLAFV